MDRLHSALWSSKPQGQSLQRQFSAHPEDLDTVPSKVGRCLASLKAVRRQVAASRFLILTESVCNESWAFVDAGTLKHLKDILVEVCRCLDDHSTLVCPSLDMFCYEVDPGLPDYMRPHVDAGRQRWVANPSALTRQKRNMAKSWIKKGFVDFSTSIDVSYRRLR